MADKPAYPAESNFPADWKAGKIITVARHQEGFIKSGPCQKLLGGMDMQITLKRIWRKHFPDREPGYGEVREWSESKEGRPIVTRILLARLLSIAIEDLDKMERGAEIPSDTAKRLAKLLEFYPANVVEFKRRAAEAGKKADTSAKPASAATGDPSAGGVTTIPSKERATQKPAGAKALPQARQSVPTGSATASLKQQPSEKDEQAEARKAARRSDLAGRIMQSADLGESFRHLAWYREEDLATFARAFTFIPSDTEDVQHGRLPSDQALVAIGRYMRSEAIEPAAIAHFQILCANAYYEPLESGNAEHSESSRKEAYESAWQLWDEMELDRDKSDYGWHLVDEAKREEREIRNAENNRRRHERRRNTEWQQFEEEIATEAEELDENPRHTTFAAAVEWLVQSRPSGLSVTDLIHKWDTSEAGLSTWRNGKNLPDKDKELRILSYMRERELPGTTIVHIRELYEVEKEKKNIESAEARHAAAEPRKEAEAVEAERELNGLRGKKARDLPSFGTLAKWTRQAARLYGPELVTAVKRKNKTVSIDSGQLSRWENDKERPSEKSLSGYGLVIPAEHFAFLRAAWILAKEGHDKEAAADTILLGARLEKFITDSGREPAELEWRAYQGKLYQLIRGDVSIHLYDPDIYRLFTTIWPPNKEFSPEEVQDIKDFLVKVEPGLVKAEGEEQLSDWLTEQIKAKNWLYIVFPPFSHEWLNKQSAVDRRHQLFHACMCFEHVNQYQCAANLGIEQATVSSWGKPFTQGGTGFYREQLGGMMQELRPSATLFEQQGRMGEYYEHMEIYALNMERLTLDVIPELNTPDGKAFIATYIETGFSKNSFLTTASVPSPFLLALPDDMQAAYLLYDLRKATGHTLNTLSQILHYDPEKIGDMEKGKETVDFAKHKPEMLISAFNLFDDRKASHGANQNNNYPYTEFRKVLDRSIAARRERDEAQALIDAQRTAEKRDASKLARKQSAAQTAKRILDGQEPMDGIYVHEIPLKTLLRLVREELELYGDELAERFGVTKMVVSNAESGARPIRLKTVQRYETEIAPERYALLMAVYRREAGADLAGLPSENAGTDAGQPAPVPVPTALTDVAVGHAEPRTSPVQPASVEQDVTNPAESSIWEVLRTGMAVLESRDTLSDEDLDRRLTGYQANILQAQGKSSLMEQRVDMSMTMSMLRRICREAGVPEERMDERVQEAYDSIVNYTPAGKAESPSPQVQDATAKDVRSSPGEGTGRGDTPS